MGMEKQITCPSGLTGEVRGLKGREAQMLSDRNAVRSGTFLDKILDACWLKTSAWGPYKSAESGKPDWKNVLVGDRFYILLQIRVASFGAEYAFKTPCQNCRKQIEYEVQLDRDLQIKSLSAADAAAFAAAEPFTVKTATGKAVTYRLPIGTDEVRAARQANGDGAFLDALGQRIVSIEGEPSVGAFLENADFADLLDLLNQMDEHDCGVETTITIDCPHCFATQDVQLPFVRDFFVPTSGRRKK
jgi:hypothetical protein